MNPELKIEGLIDNPRVTSPMKKVAMTEVA